MIMADEKQSMHLLNLEGTNGGLRAVILCSQPPELSGMSHAGFNHL